MNDSSDRQAPFLLSARAISIYEAGVNRRVFIQTLSGSVLGATVLPAFADLKVYAAHFAGAVDSAPNVPIPEGKRAPFGWHCATVTSPPQEPVVIRWSAPFPAGRPILFRIAVGLDERDEKRVEAFLPQSGRVLGTMELRFASQFQVYQIALEATDWPEIKRQGISLRLSRGTDLEIFKAGSNLPPALLPHLLFPGNTTPAEEFLARLNSLACIQQFGWMEGCVLDGLLDLAELPPHASLKKAALQHLQLFFQGSRLVYENHISAPSDDRVYGIEGTLPFAALARTNPRAPQLDIAVRFWEKTRRPSGAIQDGSTVTSEGAYTVGYALAEVARARGSSELMQLALTQVRIRQRALFDGKTFWRTLGDDGRRGNRNWARGIAWQLLGLARTLVVARNEPDLEDLKSAFTEFAAWSIALQRPDGLWSVFADEPDLTPDTAGSAGIAAALAIGVKHGFLGGAARAAATKTRDALQAHLTPDGFLGGVSQSNKGGEGLQRSSYRAIFQMGMGLQAQLIAALNSKH